MDNNDYYTIEVRRPDMRNDVGYDGSEIKMSIYWDADIERWIEVFKTILHWVTFHPDTIKEQFNNGEE